MTASDASTAAGSLSSFPSAPPPPPPLPAAAPSGAPSPLRPLISSTRSLLVSTADLVSDGEQSAAAYYNEQIARATNAQLRGVPRRFPPRAPRLRRADRGSRCRPRRGRRLPPLRPLRSAAQRCAGGAADGVDGVPRHSDGAAGGRIGIRVRGARARAAVDHQGRARRTQRRSAAAATAAQQQPRFRSSSRSSSGRCHPPQSEC